MLSRVFQDVVEMDVRGNQCASPNTSTTITIPFESLLSLQTTTQPEQHHYPSSFQPTNTIHKPKHYTSISPRSRNSIRFSLRSPHLDEFPFQNSLAQSLPTLLCSRCPHPLFLVSFLTSYAFQSHWLNTRTTITIPCQSLLQHKSFR